MRCNPTVVEGCMVNSALSVPRGELLRACMKIALALTEMNERELADAISDEAMSDSWTRIYLILPFQRRSARQAVRTLHSEELQKHLLGSCKSSFSCVIR